MLVGKAISIFSIKKYSSSASDVDAEAYFAAAGITDATQKAAYTTLVLGLKSSGLYTKFNALYPFLGGTATTHKYNAINPADSDAAFRIQWFGGITHSSTGVLFNGSTGVGDTKLNANTTLTQNDNHISFYSRTQNAVNGIDIGCSSGAAPHYDMEIFYVSRYYSNMANYASGVSASVTKGFFINSRTSSGTYKGYLNGLVEQTNSIASTGKPNYNIFIGARNNGGAASFFANRECAFCSIGTGLSDSEVTTFNTLITTFQTSLGRNV